MADEGSLVEIEKEMWFATKVEEMHLVAHELASTLAAESKK